MSGPYARGNLPKFPRSYVQEKRLSLAPTRRKTSFSRSPCSKFVTLSLLQIRLALTESLLQMRARILSWIVFTAPADLRSSLTAPASQMSSIAFKGPCSATARSEVHWLVSRAEALAPDPFLRPWEMLSCRRQFFTGVTALTLSSNGGRRTNAGRTVDAAVGGLHSSQ